MFMGQYNHTVDTKGRLIIPSKFRERLGDEFVVTCSPCSEILFLSDRPWAKRVFVGDELTKAYYTPTQNESFIRVQITDKNGKMAWTNPVKI